MRRGPKPLSPDEVVKHPVRRHLLAHLLDAGGRATAVETCAKLQIKHRGSLAVHARLLARGDFIAVEQTGRGNQRAAILTITDKGRAAVVGGDLSVLAPQMPP